MYDTKQHSIVDVPELIKVVQEALNVGLNAELLSNQESGHNEL
jgi:hypothetical protein